MYFALKGHLARLKSQKLGTLFSEKFGKPLLWFVCSFRGHLQKTYLLWCHAIHQNCVSTASLEPPLDKFYKLNWCDSWLEINACYKGECFCGVMNRNKTTYHCLGQGILIQSPQVSSNLNYPMIL